MEKEYQNIFPLTALLEDLRAQGFPIGTDTYADVQRLLAVLGPQPGREALRLSLAALLASDLAQQDAFFRTFDRHFLALYAPEAVPEADASGPAPTYRPPERPKLARYGAAAVLAVAFAFGMAYYQADFFRKVDETFGMDAGHPADTLRLPPIGTSQVDTAQIKNPKPDTKIVPTMSDEVPPPPKAEVPYQPLALPEREPYQPSFWAAYGVVVQWGLCLSVLLGYGLYEYYRWRRLKLLARRRQNQQPPFVLPIHIEDRFEVEMPDAFYLLADKLRRRVADEHEQLNLPKTVKATVANWGLFRAVFDQTSRPSEYLVLIDQSSRQNQQSAFFELLAQSMARNDVYVDRFYYRADPRVCWDAQGRPFPLQRLLSDFPKHRLLLFGGGNRLLHASTGLLQDWTRDFEAWEHRALLTPKATDAWGVDELRLGERFLLQPASVRGMAELAAAFEQAPAAQLDYWQREAGEAELKLDGLTPEIALARIERHFELKPARSGEPANLITWLQACAIFPELFWDLTLYLGNALSSGQNNLLLQENLRRLTALAWFQNGAIPDDTRRLLLAGMAPEHQRTAAQALHDLLLRQPEPEPGTFACDHRRMHVVVAELMLGPDRAERKRLLRELADLHAATPEGKTDFTVLEWLDKGEASPLDFVVDPHLLYRGGKPYQGWRTPWKLAAVALLALASFLLGLIPPDDCARVAVQGGQRYCADAPADLALLRWHEADSLLRANTMPDPAWLDTLRQLSGQGGLDSLWAANLPALQHNRSVWHYRQQAYDSVLAAAPVGPEGLHLRGLSHLYRLPKPQYDSARYYDTRLDTAFYAAQSQPHLRSELEGLALADLYDEVGSLQQNRRFVRSGNRWALLDEANRLLTDFLFESHGPFGEAGLAAVRLEGRRGFLNRQGDLRVPAEYLQLEEFARQPDGNWLALAWKAPQEGVLLDTLGRPQRYDRVLPAQAGLHRVEKNKQWGYMEAQTYREAIAPQYEAAADFAGEVAEVTSQGRRYRINRQGEEQQRPPTPKEKALALLQNQGYQVSNDPGRLVRIQNTEGLWGYADTLGQVAIAPQYAQAEPFEKGRARVTPPGGKPQAIDPAGTCVEDCPEAPALTNKRETITANGVSFDMIRVEGGTFTMGCTSEQGSDCYDDEKPAHQVTVSTYHMGETEVTQRLWEAVMGSNPSYFKNCPECPVEQVSWNDAQTFIQKLNSLTGKSFRLPTEAEWEYAARGGRQSRGYRYAGSNAIDEVAEYDGNNNKSTKPVKGKRPNELGLYDMSGNVWEWCEDWYGSYPSSAQTNPRGPATGSGRVDRGGSWLGGPRSCRVSGRDRSPDRGNRNLGFRVVH